MLYRLLQVDLGLRPGYFTALGATLQRGRYFTEAEDMSKPRVAIINQAMARQHFPDEDPLGKQLSYLSDPPVPIEIVGIVEDIREGPLDAPIPPALYIPLKQSPGKFLGVVVRASPAEGSLLPVLADVVRQINPDIVVTAAQAEQHTAHHGGRGHGRDQARDGTQANEPPGLPQHELIDRPRLRTERHAIVECADASRGRRRARRIRAPGQLPARPPGRIGQPGGGPAYRIVREPAHSLNRRRGRRAGSAPRWSRPVAGLL